MEANIHIGYDQIMGMIHQLPRNDIKKLLKNIQAEFFAEKPLSKTPSELQNILLKAPTWSETEYKEYLKAREHLNSLK